MISRTARTTERNTSPRLGKLIHMEIPMENKEKNSNLFYLIAALIVLGFIASLAFPLDAQVHKLRAAGHFNSGDFVTAKSGELKSIQIASTKHPKCMPHLSRMGATFV
jgi:hypothetical protein